MYEDKAKQWLIRPEAAAAAPVPKDAKSEESSPVEADNSLRNT